MELRSKLKPKVANMIKSNGRNSNINGTANMIKTTISNTQRPSLHQLSIQFNQLQQKFDEEVATNNRMNATIEEIKKIIKIRSDDFESTIIQLGSELDKVQQTNLILTKCIISMLTNEDVNIQFNSNQYPDRMETCDVQNQIIPLGGSVYAESTNWIQQCSLYQMLQRPNHEHRSQDKSDGVHDYSNLDEVCSKVNDLQNQIQCLNDEMAKVQADSLSLYENFITMNKQLHIMSAKYIDHSAKINLFLMDFRSQNKNIGNIDPSKYVDEKALEFAGMDVTNHNVIDKSTIDEVCTDGDKFMDDTIEIGDTYPIGSELFCSADDEGNHFGWNSSKHPYTRLLRIKIHQSCMINLNTFLSSFTKTFNYYFGRDIVDKVTISKYSMAKGLINGVEVYVQLDVPISYQYLNCIKYPSNWQFFHVSTHHKYGSQQKIKFKHKQ